ncbi:MAG: peptidase S9, partial [Bacteroidetes bacterium]
MKFAAMLLALVWAFPVLAQETDPRVWTVKDVIQQEDITGAAFSPDGKSLVWVKFRPSAKKDRFVTNLWMTRLGEAKPRELQLTRSEESDRSPMFSADGQTLYFLSSREGGKSLWALPLSGGEPYVLDSFPNGIASVRKINDSLIYYESEEGDLLYETEMEKKKDDVEVVEDTVHFKPSRVFAYNLNTKTSTRLTPSTRYPIGEFAGSEDGKWLITSHIRSPHYGVDGLPKPVYYLWNLSDGTVREVIKGMQQPSRFEFAGDNSGFYFTAVQSSNPEWDGAGIDLLYFFDLKE